MRPSLQAIDDRLEKIQDILRLIDSAEQAVISTKQRVDILSSPELCRKYWDSGVVLFCKLDKEQHDLEIKTKALAYWVRRYNREVAALGLPQVITNHLK